MAYHDVNSFKSLLFQLLIFKNQRPKITNLALGTGPKKIVEARLCRYFVSRIYDPMKSYSTKYVLSLLHLLIRPPVEPIRHLPSVLLILQYIDQNPNLFKNDKVKNIKYSWFLFFLLVSCMATFGNYVE